MDKSLLKSQIKKLLKEALTPDQVSKVEDKYNSIYSGMLKGNKKKLMKYVDPKFKRPNPDAMAMGRAINLVKKDTINEEGESWGLETRQLADSFTFDELEQLLKDNKISKADYNGAIGYLQAWVNQHPTYLPQRNLDTSQRQKVRSHFYDIKETFNETLKLGVKYDLNGETGFIRTGGSNDPKDWVFNNHSYLSVEDKLTPLGKQPGKYDGAFDMGHGKGHHIDEESVNEASELDKAAGGYPYKMVGTKAVITEPMDDATKERMIKKAKKLGYRAKPNMQGGINIYTESVNEGANLNERLTSMVREVYSEKQRKWACAQDEPKFDEMCKDTAISKKKLKEDMDEEYWADYQDIGIFYLDGFNRKHSLTNDELEILGKKIVDRLYKGDIGKAYDAIVNRDKLDIPGKPKFVKEELTSTVDKSRAKSELKQMLKGKRDDGMGKSTLKAILAIDKDGKETKIKKLEDFDKFEKGTKFSLKETTMDNDRLTELIKTALKGPANEDKDWIQKAIKRPGALHRELGVPKDKDIPKSLINKTLARLRKKDKDDEEEGTQLGAADERELRQLNLAKTLSKFNENKLTERVFKKLREAMDDAENGGGVGLKTAKLKIKVSEYEKLYISNETERRARVKGGSGENFDDIPQTPKQLRAYLEDPGYKKYVDKREKELVSKDKFLKKQIDKNNKQREDFRKNMEKVNQSADKEMQDKVSSLTKDIDSTMKDLENLELFESKGPSKKLRG